MNDEKEKFSYYEYKVGRYFPRWAEAEEEFVPYKSETKRLVWNIIDYDFNKKKIQVRNLFECSHTFLVELLFAKGHYKVFEQFAEYVRDALQYSFWSKSEYEIVVCGWPDEITLKQEDLDKYQKKLEKSNYGFVYVGYPESGHKIDVYTQVMLNWDRFIEYVWSNRKLITKKKLNLE